MRTILRHAPFATVALIMACSSKSAGGVLDGQEVDLGVGTAHIFSIDGVQSEGIFLSNQTYCFDSPPPGFRAAPQLQFQVGAVGTYTVGSPGSASVGMGVLVELRDPQADGGVVDVFASSGQLVVDHVDSSEVTGSFDLTFGSHGEVAGSFNAPKCAL